jgi:hypothetical protein
LIALIINAHHRDQLLVIVIRPTQTRL